MQIPAARCRKPVCRCLLASMHLLAGEGGWMQISASGVATWSSRPPFYRQQTRPRLMRERLGLLKVFSSLRDARDDLSCQSKIGGLSKSAEYARGKLYEDVTSCQCGVCQEATCQIYAENGNIKNPLAARETLSSLFFTPIIFANKTIFCWRYSSITAKRNRGWKGERTFFLRQSATKYVTLRKWLTATLCSKCAIFGSAEGKRRRAANPGTRVRTPLGGHYGPAASPAHATPIPASHTHHRKNWGGNDICSG